jgi:hypothetical protein
MKLGLGLYRHQLNAEHYRFAKQCGCTHLVIHLVDYFRSSRSNHPGDQPVGDDTGWGLAGNPDKLWAFEELAAIKKEINVHGLELEAVENFDPAHWHDVLLDGPKKLQQIENLKTIIRNVGKAGIPVFGYNFSIAGVAGRVKEKFARGDAEAVGMDGPHDAPLPNGMVWNMVYDKNATPGNAPSATPEQLWSRLKFFPAMILGVGSFAHSIGTALADAGADVSTYLTRNYGHFSPSLVGKTFSRDTFPSPVPLIRENKIDVVIPQSIDWALQPWAEDLMKSGVGIFSPTGEAMRIERERDFARELCAKFKIPFPKSFVASNRIEAEKILERNPQPFVIKNPLCSPTSPIHTILCETVADTRAWLRQRELCRGRFFAGISWPRRGRAHRAGQRRRDSFARHEPGIQIRLQRQPRHRRRRAARRTRRARRE